MKPQPEQQPPNDALKLRIKGVVQGVGYRPFVWHLAQECQLTGWIRNDGEGVEVHVEGLRNDLDRFMEALSHRSPPLSRVDSVAGQETTPEFHPSFAIIESGSGAVSTAVAHDSAPCPACLREMLDPAGRRWRHAFITCTHCGPRYTVTRRLPYDRPQTSLAPFPLCAACEAEYRNPADRRFHAETTCCPVCGPKLSLIDADGSAVAGDPLAAALDRLLRGEILAVKGLGGFHLMCDARNAEAVARLRQRKSREEKPFAVLFANALSMADYCDMEADALALLEAPERPIVLMRKRGDVDTRFAGVAPGIAWLGVMLPSTPIQTLLFHEALGRPAGEGWLDEVQKLALVCTSANPGGEPLVIGNVEARSRLDGIADAWLLHDRDIVVRCDDSVARFQTTPQFIRRGRGYTPRAIRLPSSGPSVLALGGWFKNTICVTRGNEAFVSQHVGDLDNGATCLYLEETVRHLLDILQIEPERVAHDLHPDFHSSRFAAAFGAERGIPVVAVQHHHAHLASALAENGHQGPALGLALDGVGLGSDGTPWGGELLRLEESHFERLGHLRPLALPGGDRAAREPWRMAAAALHDLGRAGEIAGRFPQQPGADMVAKMLERDFRTPRTSSAGRWFDAAAGLLNIKPVAAYEGQSAMMLEGLAESHIQANGVPLVSEKAWRQDDGQLDLRPLLAALADGKDAGESAARFHVGLASALANWVTKAAERERLDVVAWGGGCFLNAILSRELKKRLEAQGLRVLAPRLLPPNDGGLSLGQAWVAMQTNLVQP